jgi:hypothetical protein
MITRKPAKRSKAGILHDVFGIGSIAADPARKRERVCEIRRNQSLKFGLVSIDGHRRPRSVRYAALWGPFISRLGQRVIYSRRRPAKQNVAPGNFSEWPPVYPDARTNDAPRDVSAWRHPPKRFGCPLTVGLTMRLTPSICILALTICSTMANAADGNQPLPREAVALLEQTAPSSLAVPLESPRSGEFRGFFGYLEFDFDPNAPGGVPGFGEISNPARAVAQTQN